MAVSMPIKQYTSQLWLLICVGGMFFVLLELGIQFHIPQRFLIPPLVAIALVLASMGIWMRANVLSVREKKKWGQDDGDF
jgi:hypothetical protein